MRRTKRLAAVAVLMTAVALPVIAQDAANGNVSKPLMMAKDANPNWEVATVRPTDPNDPGGQRVRLSGRRVQLLNTTAEQFLLLGYGVQKSQLAGEPGWAKMERWNVGGVPDVEGRPNWAQIQSLMRKILTERFGLVLHREQRELPVYALVQGKGGPMMTPNTNDPNGLMDQQNSDGNGRHIEKIKNGSMDDLVTVLQPRVGRPVVDRTGLKGRYDFNLQWTTDESQLAAPDAPPGIFTAIQEQIGLKLEPVKAPVDVLVIDSIQRPGAN